MFRWVDIVLRKFVSLMKFKVFRPGYDYIPRLWPSSAAFVLGALLLAGCGVDRVRASLAAEYSEEALSPRPPAFLSGPAAALLTNATGFSALVTMEKPDAKNKPVLTGHLLGQGSHLFFSPVKGDKSFIWDVQTHTGYLLSEMMQGYAPIYLPAGITNVTTIAEVAGPAADRLNGHPGHEADVTVALDDGTKASFTVWRASDLQDFPVRIATLKTDPPFVVDFSEVRMEKLSPDLFAPPDGFTRYASPEAMTGEMVLRQSKFRNTAVQKPPESPIAPQGPKQSY